MRKRDRDRLRRSIREGMRFALWKLLVSDYTVPDAWDDPAWKVTMRHPEIPAECERAYRLACEWLDSGAIEGKADVAP